jgi:hypothetical protein
MKLKPGVLYGILTGGIQPTPTMADIHKARFYAKAARGNTQLADAGGWQGGDAFVHRVRTAVSVFDLEVELRDAERFAPWLSPKTKERARRAAEVRLAELQGEI